MHIFLQNRWSDAREFCKSHNMDLITLETKQQNDALNTYLHQRFGEKIINK